MDFESYLQMDDYEEIAKENKIFVPRTRGYRLMVEETPREGKPNSLQTQTFNKYCGQNVLYIHARIGGRNWVYYNGEALSRKRWFIEKVDDEFDNTYCDIYARIKVMNGQQV